LEASKYQCCIHIRGSVRIQCRRLMGIGRGYLGNVHKKVYDFWEKTVNPEIIASMMMKRGRNPGSWVDDTATDKRRPIACNGRPFLRGPATRKY
jgi:hypothetical protein